MDGVREDKFAALPSDTPDLNIRDYRLRKMRWDQGEGDSFRRYIRRPPRRSVVWLRMRSRRRLRQGLLDTRRGDRLGLRDQAAIEYHEYLEASAEHAWDDA